MRISRVLSALSTFGLLSVGAVARAAPGSPSPWIHLEGFSNECAEYRSGLGVRFCVSGTFVQRYVQIFKDRRALTVTTTIATVGDGSPQVPQTAVRDFRISTVNFSALQQVLSSRDIGHRFGRCNPWLGRPNAFDPAFQQVWRLTWFGPPPHRPWINSPFGTSYPTIPCAPNLMDVFNAILAAADSPSA